MQLSRRVTALETARGSTGLFHLTDEELHVRCRELIRHFGECGVDLPDDWQEQFQDEPIVVLEWVGARAKEMIECEA